MRILIHFCLGKNNEPSLGRQSEQLKTYKYLKLFVNIQEQHPDKYQKEPSSNFKREKKELPKANAHKYKIYCIFYD